MGGEKKTTKQSQLTSKVSFGSENCGFSSTYFVYVSSVQKYGMKFLTTWIRGASVCVCAYG